MSDHKVGDRVKIKLTGGRLVDAEIKATIETTEGEAAASFVWGRDRPDLSVAARWTYFEICSVTSHKFVLTGLALVLSFVQYRKKLVSQSTGQPIETL
jgi:hypothetical protein